MGRYKKLYFQETGFLIAVCVEELTQSLAMFPSVTTRDWLSLRSELENKGVTTVTVSAQWT